MGQAHRRAGKVAGIYAICGLLWIALSDRVLDATLQNHALLTQFQTYKGWAFIAVTAGLVFVLTRRALLEPERLAEEVQQGERRYRALFENVSVIGLVVDPSDGTILDANETAAAYYGLTREGLRGMSIFESHTLSLDQIRAGMAEATMGPRPPLLAQHRRADGSVRDVEMHLGPIPYERRTVLYLVIHDVTERIRVEGALRESEEHYRTLFNAITDAVFVHEVRDDGTVGPFLEVNEVACQRLGYTREELSGMTPSDIDAPESLVDLLSIGQRVMAGETVQFEQIHVGKDGRRIPVEIRAQRLTVGGRAMVLALARDSSERRQAEQALQEAKNLYETVFRLSPDVIVLTTEKEGRYLAVNDAPNGLPATAPMR